MSNIRPALVALLILMTSVTIGCRSLPRDFERSEATQAVAPATHGPLAEFAAASEARFGPDESGFILLHRNDEDFNWRLALVDSARYSLDLQTFIWGRDFSGELLFSRMHQAAERGVQVRLLVDDFGFRGRDRAIAAFDDHPNIEIKIWNPGRQRLFGRNVEYAVRLRELNHRMHNKVLIADNRVAISGGRNISNEYFGISNRANFFDLDLLAAGPVVPQISGMFDRYWDSPQATPAAIFFRNVAVADVPGVMAQLRQRLETSPFRQIFPINPQSWDDLLSEGVAALLPGEVEVIYDKPGESAPSQDALIGLQRFFRQAENEVLVINPYLVPGEAFFVEAQELADRGVHMAIMTNSLGSTDVTIVHAAYARTRIPMLKTGLKVFEMRYDAAMQADLDTPPVKSRWVALHAKAAVLDRKRVFVGSYNLSPRSKNLNTEMGLLVDSPELGEQLAEVLSEAMSPENSWQLVLDESGNLVWKSSGGKLTRQPSRNLGRRITSSFFGLFPFEQHL